ncbi:MAG: ribosome silencing factor [Actinomycetota bacterium]|nr:ribosome silencing factor [Actinomycetota bacterium]
MVEIAAQAAAEKHATDISIIDVSKIFVITDYFMICSGQTGRQVQTIAENIEDKLRELKVRKIGLEGDKEKSWILLDFGAVIVHVFTQEQRNFYQLEKLWSDAPSRTWETG